METNYSSANEIFTIISDRPLIQPNYWHHQSSFIQTKNTWSISSITLPPVTSTLSIETVLSSEQWAVSSEQWAVSSEQWAVSSEQWAVSSEQWAASKKHPQDGNLFQTKCPYIFLHSNVIFVVPIISTVFDERYSHFQFLGSAHIFILIS